MPVIARRVAKVAERAGEQGGIGVIDIIYDSIVVGSVDHTNSFWRWQRWWRHSIGHGVSFLLGEDQVIGAHGVVGRVDGG